VENITAARRGEDLVLEQALVNRVEPRERLVEDQELRAIDQRGGELDFLRHAFRHL
jgi:hypothetical protein